MVGGEKHASAIDAPGKTNADRLAGRHYAQPLRNLIRQGSNVGSANTIQVGRQCLWFRREEPRINRVRVGTANKLKFNYIMSGNHPGVAGMELRVETGRFEPFVNSINSISNHQRRAILLFGEKITQWAIERTSHSHRLPGTRH